MVKKQRVRSHTNVLDPCGVRVGGELPGLSRTPELPRYSIGDRAHGSGTRGGDQLLHHDRAYLFMVRQLTCFKPR